MQCLYCTTVLTPTTRLAHVIPEALGGRLASREICCDACNNAISPLECEVAEQLRPIAGAIGIKRQRGGEAPPAIATVAGYGSVKVRRGVSRPHGTVRHEERHLDGSSTLAVRTETRDLLVAHIVNRLFEKRKTPDDLERNNGVRIEELEAGAGRRVDLGRFEIVLNTKAQKRLAAKVALELLAFHEPALARRPEMERARAWVVGKHDGPGPVVGLDLHGGSSALLRGVEMADFANSAELWVSAAGRLVARVVVLGFFPFSVVLAVPWSTGRLALAHMVDPLTGAVRNIKTTLHVPGSGEPFSSGWSSDGCSPKPRTVFGPERQ